MHPRSLRLVALLVTVAVLGAVLFSVNLAPGRAAGVEPVLKTIL